MCGQNPRNPIGNITCEPFTYLLELEADCLPTSSSDMSQSRPSNGTRMPAKSCETGQQMDGSRASRSLKPTCEPSTSANGRDEWIASQRDSLARIFQAQVEARELREAEADSIVKSSAQLMLFDLGSSGSKTAPSSELEGAISSLPTSWRADTPGAMESLPRLMLAPATSVAAGGALLPTLTVCGNWNRKGASPTSGDGIATALRKLMPTLCATDWKSPYSAEGYAKQMQVRSKPLRDTLAHSTGHRLTSAFAEWWMGWPIGWTALNAPAMVKFRSQRPQHGKSSEARDVR